MWLTTPTVTKTNWVYTKYSSGIRTGSFTFLFNESFVRRPDENERKEGRERGVSQPLGSSSELVKLFETQTCFS